MKIGVLASVLQGEWDDVYKRAADLGFEGVELDVWIDYVKKDLWNLQGQVKLKRKAQEAGISTPSTCIHAFWKTSPASDDQNEQEQARILIQEAIQATAGVGATNILIPLTCPKGVDERCARQRWIEMVKQVAPEAENAGVVICLENVNQPFANHPREVCQVVDAIGSPAVKTYFDPANAVQSEIDPIEAISLLGNRIAQVHTKEYGGTYIGEGTVPWKEIIAELKKCGYDGWLVFETEPTDNPTEAAKKNLEYIKTQV
jgi:sugar phosphate isomerase/epimerase